MSNKVKQIVMAAAPVALAATAASALALSVEQGRTDAPGMGTRADEPVASPSPSASPSASPSPSPSPSPSVSPSPIQTIEVVDGLRQ